MEKLEKAHELGLNRNRKMNQLIGAIAATGWLIATVLGVHNRNLRREINELKRREEIRERENKFNHKRFEHMLQKFGDMLAQTSSEVNAKQKVDEIFRQAIEKANEELRNEPPTHL